MATRFADPPLAYTPPLKPNVTVAFVAGPALAAANDAVTKLPEAEQTLDELALTAAIDHVIDAARTLLSPHVAETFFAFLESGAYFGMTCGVDAEADARCNAHYQSVRKIEREAARNAHDWAVLAFAQQIEEYDAPPCGPRNYQTSYYREEGLLHTIARLSPLPDLIDDMARLAWDASKPVKGAWSEPVALLVMEKANGARRRMPDKSPIDRPAAWRDAFDRYERLRRASDDLPAGHSQEDVALERYCAAMDRLIRDVRAPDLAAISTKLRLIKERFGEDGTVEWLADALLADTATLVVMQDVIA